MSLATYVRLSLELVGLLDASQWYLKNFLLSRPWQMKEALAHQREVGTQDGSAVRMNTRGACWKGLFSVLFPSRTSRSVHLFLDSPSFQIKARDPKTGLCHMRTAALLQKTLMTLIFTS